MRRAAGALAAAALLAAAAAPFWAGRFLPMLDLPQHLGLAAAIARYGDRAAGFARYYAVDGRVTPYWGYYAAMHGLVPLAGVEAANRLLLGGYAVGLPLAAGYALSCLGRDWRWAVFALPLVFNANLFFGFTSFLLSLPLFLLAVALSARFLAAARPGPRLALETAVAAALVYLFHAQSYGLLGLCVLFLGAVEWRGPGWAAARALAYAPSLALLAPWAWRSFLRPAAPGPIHTPGHPGYGALGALGARFEPLGEVVWRIPERLVGAYNDGSDYLLGSALLGLFVVAVVAGRGSGSGSGTRSWSRTRAFLREHRGEALAVLLFASYFAAPMEIAGQWYINPRHLVFAALLAPAFVAAPAAGLRRWLLAPAAAVALAASANAAAKVRAFQDQVGPFPEVLAAMSPGGRLMNLVFDRGEDGPVRRWPLLHFGCYYQALLGGDVSFSFAGLPSIPLAYRPGMQAPHPNEWRPQDFRWETMGQFYDWFLVRGEARGAAARLGRQADLVKRAGEWTLYRRRIGLTGRGPSATEPP